MESSVIQEKESDNAQLHQNFDIATEKLTLWFYLCLVKNMQMFRLKNTIMRWSGKKNKGGLRKIWKNTFKKKKDKALETNEKLNVKPSTVTFWDSYNQLVSVITLCYCLRLGCCLALGDDVFLYSLCMGKYLNSTDKTSKRDWEITRCYGWGI